MTPHDALAVIGAIALLRLGYLELVSVAARIRAHSAAERVGRTYWWHRDTTARRSRIWPAIIASALIVFAASLAYTAVAGGGW